MKFIAIYMVLLFVNNNDVAMTILKTKVKCCSDLSGLPSTHPFPHHLNQDQDLGPALLSMSTPHTLPSPLHQLP